MWTCFAHCRNNRSSPAVMASPRQVHERARNRRNAVWGLAESIKVPQSQQPPVRGRCGPTLMNSTIPAAAIGKIRSTQPFRSQPKRLRRTRPGEPLHFSDRRYRSPR